MRERWELQNDEGVGEGGLTWGSDGREWVFGGT